MPSEDMVTNLQYRLWFHEQVGIKKIAFITNIAISNKSVLTVNKMIHKPWRWTNNTQSADQKSLLIRNDQVKANIPKHFSVGTDHTPQQSCHVTGCSPQATDRVLGHWLWLIGPHLLRGHTVICGATDYHSWGHTLSLGPLTITHGATHYHWGHWPSLDRPPKWKHWPLVSRPLCGVVAGWPRWIRCH